MYEADEEEAVDADRGPPRSSDAHFCCPRRSRTVAERVRWLDPDPDPEAEVLAKDEEEEEEAGVWENVEEEVEVEAETGIM